MTGARVVRLGYLLVAITAMLILPGCPPSNEFCGRIFIINLTGKVLGSPELSSSYLSVTSDRNRVGPYLSEQRYELADIADRQAGIVDCHGNNTLVVLGELKLTYIDHNGGLRTRWVPFGGHIPDNCYDDFFIEIDWNDQLRSGLLDHRYDLAYNYVFIYSHALAGLTGLLLGRMVWRKANVSRAKSADYPDLGV